MSLPCLRIVFFVFPAFPFSGYPWLKLTDMVAMLAKRKRLHLLLPNFGFEKAQQDLTEYWRRFKLQYEDHELWDIVPEEALPLTVPIKLHGDEGRSTLTGIMLFCWTWFPLAGQRRCFCEAKKRCLSW